MAAKAGPLKPSSDNLKSICSIWLWVFPSSFLITDPYNCIFLATIVQIVDGSPITKKTKHETYNGIIMHGVQLELKSNSHCAMSLWICAGRLDWPMISSYAIAFQLLLSLLENEMQKKKKKHSNANFSSMLHTVFCKGLSADVLGWRSTQMPQITKLRFTLYLINRWEREHFNHFRTH